MANDRFFIEAEIKLYAYNEIKFDIDNLNYELQLIINEYSKGVSVPGLQSVNYSAIKVSKTNSITPIEDWLLCRDKKYNDLFDLKLKKVMQIKKIDNVLKLLTDLEVKVIKMRYFEKASWAVVAEETCYSISYCKSVRVKAINKIKYKI